MTTRGLLGRPSLATFIQNLFAPRGLPGAQAASRYVGATASGAPTSGTFAVGDYIVDQTGKMYVCTIAGSPGTWNVTGLLIARGADASLPAAGTAGQLYLPTDGFAAHEDNGSNQRQWGPLFPLTAPVDGDFAWINQGGATVTVQNSGIYLYAPNQGAADNFRIRKKAAPSTPYTVTMFFRPGIWAKNYNAYGLVWRQSSDGKLVSLNHSYNSGQLLGVTKWSSPTAISADYVSVGAFGPWNWLRLRDDGTTRYCYASPDGQNWLLVHSIGRTDYMTPNEVGFYVNANNAATPNLDCGMTVLSWVEA